MPSLTAIFKAPIPEWQCVRRNPRPLTIPLAFIAAYLLVILNVTGFPSAVFSGGSIGGGNSFGWPKEYAVTDLTNDQHLQLINYWLSRKGRVSPGAISLRRDVVQKFSAGLLFFNVVACLAVVLLVAFAAEYWQRYFGRPRQIGLRSLFVFVLLAALVAFFSRNDWYMNWCFAYSQWLRLAVVGIFVVGALATAVIAMRQHPRRSRPS